MNEFSQQYLPSRPILNVRNTGKIRTTHVEKVLVIQLLNQHCRQQLLEFLGDSTQMFVPHECQIHVFYFFHCSTPSPQHICLFLTLQWSSIFLNAQKQGAWEWSEGSIGQWLT